MVFRLGELVFWLGIFVMLKVLGVFWLGTMWC